MAESGGPPWRPLLAAAQVAASRGAWDGLEQACDQLLNQWGQHADALLDGAVLLLQAGSLSRAEALLGRALQLRPDDPRALLNLANVWLHSLRQEQAVQLYRQLVAHWPGEPRFRQNLLMALAYLPQAGAAEARAGAEAWAGLLRHQLAAGHQALPPSAARARAAAGRPLLGFLSGDLCQHTVGLFLLPLVEQLRAQGCCELVFYSSSPQIDWLSQRLQACGHWRDCGALSDGELAQQIRSDGVDVLVDLSGHTARSRLAVLVQRPAPRQLSWLGYWGSTGLAAGELDGVLVDPHVLPPAAESALREAADMESAFTERLLWLPRSRWCYRPVPWMPQPAEPPCLRQGSVTFGCFNSTAKLHRQLLVCWAGILRAVPGSRLVLKWVHLRDPALQQRLLALFAELGIGPERLELRGPSFHAAMLQEYNDVDIALDPFPFNGGLTSCEALWMGLPLLTLVQDGPQAPGDGPASLMAGRQGAALLELIGRPEWIARSPEQLIATAAALAADPEGLARLRPQLRDGLRASPLCDEAGFARDFSRAVLNLGSS